MAICDICKEVMPGIHHSQIFKPGTPIPIGWKIAEHDEIVQSRDLLKHAIMVNFQQFGMSSEQSTDEYMQMWVKELNSRHGQTDWMLCPTCSGFLAHSIQAHM
jgi:hypothetical protein